MWIKSILCWLLEPKALARTAIRAGRLRHQSCMLIQYAGRCGRATLEGYQTVARGSSCGSANARSAVAEPWTPRLAQRQPEPPVDGRLGGSRQGRMGCSAARSRPGHHHQKWRRVGGRRSGTAQRPQLRVLPSGLVVPGGWHRSTLAPNRASRRRCRTTCRRSSHRANYSGRIIPTNSPCEMLASLLRAKRRPSTAWSDHIEAGGVELCDKAPSTRRKRSRRSRVVLNGVQTSSGHEQIKHPGHLVRLIKSGELDNLDDGGKEASGQAVAL